MSFRKTICNPTSHTEYQSSLIPNTLTYKRTKQKHPLFNFPYITNHSCRQEKAMKIQKDKSLDKRPISDKFTKEVND
jgi:hypothetical protein